MNLDLGHQLLLCTGLRQSRLHNDFRSRDSLVLEVGELKAAGESTLAEELAFQILLDADLAVVLHDFLFNDGLSSIDAFLRITLLHLLFFFVSLIINS